MAGSQRPTMSPPFDPEAFARESESQLRVSAPVASSNMKVRSALPAPSSVPMFEPARDPIPILLALDRVPTLAITFGELRTLQLDHRAGFLVSLIDGMSTVEMILDVCGMPSSEAAAMLAGFLERGIVTLA